MTLIPHDHPYRTDVLVGLVIGPALVGIETWRRWGDLLRAHTVDDYILGGLLVVSALLLVKRHRYAQDLWVFTWGAASLLITLSCIGQLEMMHELDPSGMPFAAVIAVKLAMLALVGVMTVRAFRLSSRVRLHPPS